MRAQHVCGNDGVFVTLGQVFGDMSMEQVFNQYKFKRPQFAMTDALMRTFGKASYSAMTLGVSPRALFHLLYVARAVQQSDGNMKPATAELTKLLTSVKQYQQGYTLADGIQYNVASGGMECLNCPGVGAANGCVQCIVAKRET